MITKPMLAGKVEDVNDLKFPLLATPKLDGIRCLIIDGKALSRNFKPIPNHHINKLLSTGYLNGLDGELMLKNKAPFNEVSSAVMSEDGEPDFVYKVFDYVKDDIDKPYRDRMIDLQSRKEVGYIDKILPTVIKNIKELMDFEERCLAQGHEGVMVRDPAGPYKEGRSTSREGWLLKMKRFEDAEAVIIGFEEKLHNTNEAEKNAFGRTKRSHCQAGMIPDGTLGKVIVKGIKAFEDVQFNVGSGFDDALRQEIWDHQDKYLGKIITYKFQPHGVVDKPRVPIFKGFRDKIDI